MCLQVVINSDLELRFVDLSAFVIYISPAATSCIYLSLVSMIWGLEVANFLDFLAPFHPLLELIVV